MREHAVHEPIRLSMYVIYAGKHNTKGAHYTDRLCSCKVVMAVCSRMLARSRFTRNKAYEYHVGIYYNIPACTTPRS